MLVGGMHTNKIWEGGLWGCRCKQGDASGSQRP